MNEFAWLTVASVGIGVTVGTLVGLVMRYRILREIDKDTKWPRGWGES